MESERMSPSFRLFAYIGRHSPASSHPDPAIADWRLLEAPGGPGGSGRSLQVPGGPWRPLRSSQLKEKREDDLLEVGIEGVALNPNRK